MPALLLLFGPVLAVGLAGFLVSMNARGGDPKFAYDQQHPAVVEAGPLAQAVKQGREPVANNAGRPGVRATCRPGGQAGALRNPWTCTVLYPSGHRIRYVLRVNADGTFHGSDSRNVATIDGHLKALGSSVD